MSQPNTGSSTKVQPIRARLEKFKTREEFARGYRQYITNDGILLPTRQVKEIGTRIALKLEIADGSVGLRADGEVTEHRRNSKGQTVAMFIRFDRIDPASQAVIQLALAEASDAAPKTQPEPAPEQSTPPVERPDLEAFAEELDSTFDAIFTSGAFGSVGESTDSVADQNESPGLSLGASPRLASAASDADDHRQEWANTLSSDFAVAESGDDDTSADSDAEDEDDRTEDRAAQLLAAFGVTDPEQPAPVEAADPAATAVPDEPPAIGATTENSAVQAVARISVGKVAPGPNPRAAALLKTASEAELAERKTAGAAWLESAVSDSTERSGAQSSELRELIARVTSDHAIIEDGDSSLSPLPKATALDEEDDDLFAGLVDDERTRISPPPAVLKNLAVTAENAVAPANALHEEGEMDESPDDEPISADEASADDGETSGAPLDVARPKGLFARFFAWLGSLFGGSKG